MSNLFLLFYLEEIIRSIYSASLFRKQQRRDIRCIFIFGFIVIRRRQIRSRL